MGELEKESRKRAQKGNIQKAILSGIAAVGLLSVAVLAPNALQALKFFGIEPKNKWQKYNINHSIKRLKEHGLICFETTSRGTFARLTPKGEDKLRKFELLGYKLKKPKKWDRKWRMLIFDINESRKGTRDKIRFSLKRIGFLRLQDSVWVYPYDCEDFITLLKADFKIGKDLLYLIVDSIEGDRNIINHFKL
jgi:DNA-binding transcriptional regulator PaaX